MSMQKERIEIRTISIKRKVLSIALLFIFSIFIFYGCSRYNYSNYKKLKIPEKEKRLNSTVVGNYRFNFPVGLLLVKNYLVVADIKSDSIIKLIDLNTNEIVKSFGHEGQGPDEFISVNILPSPKQDGSFWVYDVSTKNLKKFSIDDILNDNFYPEKIIHMSTKIGSPFVLKITPDERILATGYFSEERIGVYDMNGNYIRSIGKVPVRFQKEFSRQHSHGFMGRVTFNENKKLIFVATQYGSIVEKYSIDGKLLRTYIGPDLFFPEYDIVPAGESYTMTYNNKSRWGYFGIHYSSALDKIFLLYSGVYQFNKENVSPNYSNTIYVLDDNKEELVEKIKLDKRIGPMVLSEDCSEIFGISEDSKILKFNYKKD